MVVVSDDQLNAKTTPLVKYPPHPLFPNLHFLPIFGQRRGLEVAGDLHPMLIHHILPCSLILYLFGFLLLVLNIGVHHDPEPVLTIQLSAKF